MNASYIRNLEDNTLSKMIIKEVDRPKEKGGLVSEKVSIKDITDRISILTPLIRERLRNVSESSFLLEYFFYDDLEIKKDTLLPKKVAPKSIIDGLAK